MTTEFKTIIETLQLQRNTALDNCVNLTSQLAVAEEQLKKLQATIDDMIKNQLPDTSELPIA